MEAVSKIIHWLQRSDDEKLKEESDNGYLCDVFESTKLYATMQRIPVFMYDRVTGDVELMFVAKTHLERSYLAINDHMTRAPLLVKVPRLTPERPFALVLHEKGDQYQMIAIDEAFMNRIKTMRFNKELLNKHLERGSRASRTTRFCSRRSKSILHRVTTA